MSVLDIFDQQTKDWFERAVGTPTAVQEAAWPPISAGKHTLVSAPTGTGKTLAAFLVFIDRMLAMQRQGVLKQELHLIYVSPLKSLAGDIRENLRRPLDDISFAEQTAGRLAGGALNGLNIAVRTGDTPQNERRRMIKTPPHILITTPESLYLMLTGRSGQSILRTARWLIIDELHALIDSKRGAHLMLSIARLDNLCSTPLQRIGLSATIEPLNIAAEYLAPDPVTIAAPEMHKKISLQIVWPLTEKRLVEKDAVWQQIAASVYEHCKDVRSVIAFAEARAYAEKLAYYVNLLGGEGFAKTHHGSLSKEQRHDVEQSLRGGSLRLLCATSSMELGIDVGEIDLVFQIGCPRSISSTMQRLGRAGHNPNRTSAMYIFPRVAAEGLYSGLAAEVVRQGGIEHSRPPRLCLDILAQHLVSMAAVDGYSLDEVMTILARAYPFREVTLGDVRDVLCMLSGDDEHNRDIPVRPRLLYDRIHERVDGDPYSRMLAVSAGGTIPDKGLYAVRTENGTKLGELDEEFVFEARLGDKFLLGTFAWQISEIKKDTVIVRQSTLSGARPPFWKGELKGRRLQTGLAYGEIFRRLSIAHETETLLEELEQLGLDEAAATGAQELIKHQFAVTGSLPDDRTMLVEFFRDETGNHQMMVHSVFGRTVNEPLAILATEQAKRLMGINIGFVADDDGFLLFPYEDSVFPERLLERVKPDSARPVLSAMLPATPLFNMAFRYNCARALMMGIRKAGRQPLWVQRLRSAEMLEALIRQEKHPLIRETKRECLEDYWDLPGVELILNGIQSGAIHVREMYLEAPSPLSLPLRQHTEAASMYDYAPTPHGINAAVQEVLDQVARIVPSREQLAKLSSPKRMPGNESQLHSQLMIEGDMTAEETMAPLEWLGALEGRGQVVYIEPGFWIAAEHAKEYDAALTGGDMEARLHIVRRLLRYRGAHSSSELASRYFWTRETAQEVLQALCETGTVLNHEGLYYHTAVFARAQRETVKQRRSEITTLPPERYAALLAGRVCINAPMQDRVDEALKMLCNQPFPAALWESMLLPARLIRYRPELLDAVLARGSVYWRMSLESGLSFHRYEDIDWDADLSEGGEALTGNEKIIFDALLKRGASFTSRLVDLLANASPYEALLGLAEKGLVTADSFVPVRHLLNKEKTGDMTVKQRVKARTAAMTSGRWELLRPLRQLTLEEQLERLFDRFIILCRETARDIDWQNALRVLRVWEYTGRVRRGYFVEGLSGIQYIRDREFAGVMQLLEQPSDGVLWLPAADPAQPWGKTLSHLQDRNFMNIPGSAVALRAGVPVAVFERLGKTLRVFDAAALPEALLEFARDFSGHRIFPSLRRITVKQYPQEAEKAFEAAGFSREMQDYILYRAI